MHRLIILFKFLLKWLLICILSGILVGSASALLLISLNWATQTRESHLWLISLLPLGGLLVGFLYYYYGREVVRGTNQLLEEMHTPSSIIPFIMVPMIYIGTIVTHLFGGSAGREGTAVQMGGAIVDQISKYLNLSKKDRKILLIIGISAGFASVFGTPLAGAVFALEVLIVGRIRYNAIIPSLLTALIAHYMCNDVLNVHHTHYSIDIIPKLSVKNSAIIILVGIIFGITSYFFSKTIRFFQTYIEKIIAYPPMRPFFGGIIISSVVFISGTTKYIGLGIPTIFESFRIAQPEYAFAVKLLLTTFTIAVGFKGGEVTPLFFIGAVLGNTLSMFLPLPMALLAGMGFVAVFSGATNTPIASTIMGIELFGPKGSVYLAGSCVIAYIFSGGKGIYKSQIIKR